MITKNYIKMCEGNKDLQKVWKPKQFDSYYNKAMKRVFILGESNLVNISEKFIEMYAWLPTQERLQEMVSRNWHDVFCNFLWWHSDDDKSSEEFESMFTSMNEVWLAFVMKEKYQKTWTGKKWEVTK